MILKQYEISKINLKEFPVLLFYGQNSGAKEEEMLNLINRDKDIKPDIYEEKQVLENYETFHNHIISDSLFEEKKIIIIKRGTDKLLKIIQNLNEKKLSNFLLVIDSANLEKKSKLRNYFEKNKKLICIPFYLDNTSQLNQIINNYFKQINFPISQSNINLIVNKSNGDRENLFNELKKMEFFSKNGKKITTENISKLINLSENHSISELIDNCLAKNSKKTIHILNENNFSNEDCILITRVFLNKAKKILKLSKEFEKNNNIDLTISSAKPPIFWKHKEITKQQIYNWKTNNIKNLIFKINDIELLLKKNLNNSINVITDFLLEQSSYKTNS